MYAEPGEILLPALPWFIVPDLLSSNGPALDVHAFPDLLVDELIDLGAKPTSDLLRLLGHVLEFGEVWQGELLPARLGAGCGKPVGRMLFCERFAGEMEQLIQVSFSDEFLVPSRLGEHPILVAGD